MKKIIFFSKNLEIGGMEKSLIKLLNTLISDYEITLVLEEKKGCLLDNLDESIKIEEYKVSNLKFGLLRKIINYTKRLFWTLNNKNKYDFSCNYATYSLIGSRLARIASKNSAFYVHSDYYNVYEKNKKEIENFFNPHRLNEFRNIIFVSNGSYRNFLKIYPQYKKNSVVINNLIDYENIIKLSKEKINFDIFQKENYNLLFIGRLDNTSKNFDLLIDSLSIVVKKRKNIKLFLIGNGDYLNSLKKFVKEFRLDNYVVFLGEKKNPYPYMKFCDSIILTSRYEGFPVIYLEALVLNKKVLTTICVEDDFININDYFTILPIDKNGIADIIIKEEREDIDYNIDYISLNQKNLNKLLKIIERSVN